MNNLYNNYNYSKQFILIENLEKKAFSKLKKEHKQVDLDDYLYNVVTSVSQKEYKGLLYHLIQCEDKEVGWIHLEKSIQIFRDEATTVKLIEEEFITNELVEKMGISKDFISHFRQRLLTSKSELLYDNEPFISIFIDKKFHGFHPKKYFDQIINVNEKLDPKNVDSNIKFYAQSNLSVEISEENIEEIELISVFKKLNIAKVLVNGSKGYWVDLRTLKYNTQRLSNTEPSELDLFVKDLLYSVKNERQKSKDILKTLISAKDYLSNREQVFSDKQFGIQDEIDELKEEIQELKGLNLSVNNQIKLSEKRLNHQRDYNERLSAQRDKYKTRMELVENKMKALIEQNNQLKEKLKSK